MESVKINTTPKGARSICYASQYDNGRIVRFELFSELLPYKLDGSETIKIKVVRPDNVEIIETVTNTEDYYIDVNISSDMTALAGVASCELEIKKGETVIGSRNFDMNIESDSYGSDISIGEAQGLIATFETDIIDNLVSLKTTFEPKQDLHGYPSPWIDSNVVNKAPYLSRALAGTASRIGNYEFNKLVGGTYPFNQLVDVQDSGQGLTPQIDSDGVISVSGVSTYGYSNITKNIEIRDNHKYYAAITVISNPNDISFYWSFLNANLTPPASTGASSESASRIFMVNSHTGNTSGIAGFNANTDFTGFKTKIICIDLTQLFGSTIADYIYSLETAQAGAGVSFFKALFDKDYYPYNAGELISVKPTAHITRDGNNTVISNTALDPDIELRGIPKLDENNKLYYDGDTYESNGDVTRRFSPLIVDGVNVTVTAWNRPNEYGGFACYISINDIKGSEKIRSLCDKFIVSNKSIDDAPILSAGLNSGANSTYSFILPASVTTQAEANTWFQNNPTTVLYEKDTPTIESADPFTDPQEIDPNGSEEFTDARAVSIPVGHESYYANICEITGIDEITFYHSGEDTQDPESALVEIGQTVYGGYYDKDLGIVLTKKIVDLGSLSFGAGFGGFYTGDLKNEIKIVTDLETPNLLSSAYKAIAYSNLLTDINTVAIVYGGADYAYNGIVVFNDTRYPDAASFKAGVNGVTLCYELKDPIIIPADAVNFETVRGVNNVWSDTNGETEVKFYVKEA